MNYEVIFMLLVLGFMVFVFGVVAIVAITHGEGYIADKAIDSITSVARNITARLYNKVD